MGSMTRDEFWKKIDKTETCWNWTGKVNGSGYGTLVIAGKLDGAHRHGYREQIYGPMHPRLFVLHRCDNKRCIRLDHLFQGTQSANMQDASEKGLLRNGFRWTKENHHHLPMSEKNKQAMSERKCKPFSVMAPTGEIVSGDNLTQFCRINGLNQGGMWSVINGTKQSHKGYTKAP